MEFGRFDGDLVSLSVDLLAVGVHKDEAWADSAPGSELNEALGGLAVSVADQESFDGADGQQVCLHTHGRIGPGRILLVGLGEATDDDGRRLAARALRSARVLKLSTVGIASPNGSTAPELVLGSVLADYSFDRWKTVDRKPSSVQRVELVKAQGGDSEAARTIADAVCWARDLVNEPPATMTPTILADAAREMADEVALECRIYDQAELESMGMRLILAVAAGSTEEPRLIHLTWRPPGAGPDTPSVAIVGKGLTFDAGGLCLKPTGSIEDMKMDMGGGAAVVAAMRAIPAISPNIVVHGIVPSSENLLGAAAYKPGDIFESYNGKTVEVLNTDAEGRLILADALHYAAQQEPREIMDLATLTGAICVALGNDTIGVFSNREELAEEVLQAGKDAGESLWHMPLDHRLRKQLDTPNADMKNVGKRWGGAITAALFLHEFVGDVPWVHLDIAGPAFSEKIRDHIPKGATGVGVLTIVEYVRRAAERLT